MKDEEEKKNNFGKELIPIREDDGSNANASQDAVVNFKGAVDDDIFYDETGTSKEGETLEAEFAKAAKDGTLYEKYSEYLKRNEERLKDPNFANLKDSIKEDIRQLKEAYYDAAGLSRKICPKCGKIHEKDAKLSTCHDLPLYVVGQCRACEADLSSAQGYSAINNCPKCGAELTAPQKKIINGLLVKTQAETKYACSKCGKICDKTMKYCPDCTGKVVPMQCGQCGEILRQNEDGEFDKHCPICGMASPIETAKMGQQQQEELLKKAEAELEEVRKQLAKKKEEMEHLEEENRKLRQELKEKAKKAEQGKEKTVKQEPTAGGKRGRGLATLIITAALLLIGMCIFIGNKASSQSKVCSALVKEDCKVGAIIEFGSYPYYENGGEKAIEWQILEKYNDGTALVISKYALDNVKYNERKKSVTWETSTIRSWLNNEFYNKAFRNVDKNLIIESYIENNDNAKYKTKGGDSTYDKMFLLSIEEARKYFSSDYERKLLPTPYAKTVNNGRLYTSADYGGSCWWWQRSPGSHQNYAAIVSYGGSVNSNGNDVDNDSCAVRVAFKINLKNL